MPGYADALTGADWVILSVRPGITGPATLKYRDEEILLASVDDPAAYNREVIWPDKVRLNREAARREAHARLHGIYRERFEARDPDLPPLFPDPARYLRTAGWVA